MRFFFAFIFLSFALFSNEKKNHYSDKGFLDRDIFISASPFYLQYDGLKLNFETKDTASSISYSFSPILYFGNLSDDILFYRLSNPDGADISGGGAEATIKYFTNKRLMFNFLNIYIGLQTSFHRVRLSDFSKEVFVDELIDGIPLKSIEERQSELSVQKITTNLLFGGIFLFENYMTFGFEFQYGLNFADINEKYEPVKAFNDTFFTTNGNDYYIDIKFGVWLGDLFN